MSKGEIEIASSTLPKINAKNVKLSGTRHSETGVVFDERGLPILDDVAVYETRVTGNLGKMTSDAHKRMATRQLRANINSGKIDRGLFTDAEFLDITKGKDKIGGFTWHHHQDTGRMQLVPTEIHKWVKHLGGNELWGMKK